MTFQTSSSLEVLSDHVYYCRFEEAVPKSGCGSCGCGFSGGIPARKSHQIGKVTAGFVIHFRDERVSQIKTKRPHCALKQLSQQAITDKGFDHG